MIGPACRPTIQPTTTTGELVRRPPASQTTSVGKGEDNADTGTHSRLVLRLRSHLGRSPHASLWSPANTSGSWDHALTSGSGRVLVFECKGVDSTGNSWRVRYVNLNCRYMPGTHQTSSICFSAASHEEAVDHQVQRGKLPGACWVLSVPSVGAVDAASDGREFAEYSAGAAPHCNSALVQPLGLVHPRS